jgi:NodT family efflux transporter outer membrane factor (OMF) lipoprotein
MDDPDLTRCIELALEANPDLKAARARILQSRAMLAQQRAGLYPDGYGTAAAARASVPTQQLSDLESRLSQVAPATANTPVNIPRHYYFNLFSVGFDALWELDLFGGTRRGIESARAQTEAAAARYEDSQVQLAAEVGQAYVNLRDAQVRLALTQQSSAIQRQMLELTRARRAGGTADELDVARIEAQARQTEAQLGPLRGQLEQALDELAVLAGQEPGALPTDLSQPRSLPVTRQQIAIGSPAAMLRRRPDIRAAERQLAASNAAIGQSIARLFPTVTLLGSLSLTSNKTATLFENSSLSALAAPTLSWNFLDFGRLRAQVREARAINEESLATYQSTVLQALQDAESSLSRFGHQRENVGALEDALTVSRRSAQLASDRYQGGTASSLDALDAERQRLEAEQSLEQAQAQLSNDYIALQKSLGLGWQEVDWPKLPEPSATSDNLARR